ncbi:hypothetical protein D9M68_489580 [compost metagenome]
MHALRQQRGVGFGAAGKRRRLRAPRHQRLQACRQRLQQHWLDEAAVHAGVVAATGFASVGVRGQRDDAHRVACRAQPAAERVAIHDRHLHIGQHHVEGPRRAGRQPLRAVARQLHRAAKPLKLATQQ